MALSGLLPHLQRASTIPLQVARTVGSRLLPTEAANSLQSTTAVVLNHAFKELGSQLRVSQAKEDLLRSDKVVAVADLEQQAADLTQQLEDIHNHIALAKAKEVGAEELDGGEEYEEPDELTRVLTRWYTVPSSPHIPYRMLRDFELYPQWMPWCTDSQILDRDEYGNVKAVEVTFGIRTGPFGSVGDSVSYQVELKEPDPEGIVPYKKQAAVIATNNGCRYATMLQYYWTMTPIDAHGQLSKVTLKLTFKARHRWYLALWDTLRRQVVDGMATAFGERHKILKTAEEQSKFVVTPRHSLTGQEFPGETLSQVLNGPFKGETPVAVTEKDGRTIRYINEAFSELTGYTREEAEGQLINSLLQGQETNKGVTNALGSSVRSKLPASARIVNYRKDGQAFLNHLSFAPILDTEGHSDDIIFWALLHNIGDDPDNLEIIKGPQGQRLLPMSKTRIQEAWDNFKEVWKK